MHVRLGFLSFHSGDVFIRWQSSTASISGSVTLLYEIVANSSSQELDIPALETTMHVPKSMRTRLIVHSRQGETLVFELRLNFDGANRKMDLRAGFGLDG